MAAPLTPVEAGADQGTSLPAQSRQVDAELGDPGLAVYGQLQELTVTSDQSALIHALEESNPRLPGEMVVADPRSPKPLVSRAGADCPTYRHHPHHALEKRGDLGRCNPEVSVTTLDCEGDQPRLLQLCQVAAGRRGSHSCIERKFRSGERPPIHQGVQDLSSRAFADG
jgi:hypothetical protein